MGDVLLAVVDDTSSSYTYPELIKLTFFDGELYTNKIGEFTTYSTSNGPFPRNVAFNPNMNANEVWVSFAHDNTLQIMDTNTGKVKAKYNYPSSSSYGYSFYPYFVIPASLEGNAVNGALQLYGSRTGYQFVTMLLIAETTNAYGRLNISSVVNDAVYLELGGNALCVCGSTAYYMFEEPGYKISSFDIYSGAVKTVYHLPTDMEAYAISALCF